MSFPRALPPSPRLAVFDLDGTLIDSLEDLADSANAVLAARGFPIHPVPEYRHFVGDGARVLMERILPDDENRDQALVESCLADYVKEYDSRWKSKTRCYEGIPELLEELARRGLQLAVLSNKPHSFTVRCVEALCPLPPSKPWSIVLGLREGHAKKPDPCGLLEILDRLQVRPEETLYFGDTDTDMQTAVAGNVFPVGVLWGFREKDELIEHGAQLVLERPMDLFESELFP